MAQMNPKVGLPSGDKVITYIFDKAFHPNIKNIKKWLSLWGCSTSGIKETENNYRVKQESSSKFELGTLRTIDIADGISAVVGKFKFSSSKKNPPALSLQQSKQRIAELHRQGYSTRVETLPDGTQIVLKKKKKRNSAVRVPNPDKYPRWFWPLYDARPKWAAEASPAEWYTYTRKEMEAMAHTPRSMFRKKRNSAVRVGNPQHFPKMKAGRPRKRGRPSKAKGKMFSRGRKAHIAWWILDLYRGTTLLTTAMGQGTKANATLEAKAMMGRHIKHKTVNKITLSGPYESKPSKDVIHSMVRR